MSHDLFTIQNLVTLLLTLRRMGLSATMVQRHGDYVTTHIKMMYTDSKDFTADNLAGIIPFFYWMLTFGSIQHLRGQVDQLWGVGLVPGYIIGSEQGRGPHTGIALCERFGELGTPVPFYHNARLNWCSYKRDELREMLDKYQGDEFVTAWMNGELPGLCNETPEAFEGRIDSVIGESLKFDGFSILTTHFEVVYAAYMKHVLKRERGNFGTDWYPTKNGGVVLWKDEKGEIHGREYRPDYTLV